MNEQVTFTILLAFDLVILSFGIFLFASGMKMKKTKKMEAFILTEEELSRCQHKEKLAEFFCWREAVIGIVFFLFGVFRLLDKFVWKIGRMLDIGLMLVLLITALWFFAGIQKARAQFL